MPQPCAPNLNPVSNGGSGSPFPSPLDASDIPIMDSNPGFGDAVQQMIDDAAAADDGWDGAVAAVLQSITDWDTAETAADVELDAILTTQLPTLDTTNLDADITSFQNTLPTSQSLIDAVGKIPTPTTSPIDIGWYPRSKYNVTPPTPDYPQVNGQIMQGGPPFKYRFTTPVDLLGTGTIRGAYTPSPTADLTGARLVSVGSPYPVNAPGHPGLQAVDVVIEVDVNPVQPGPWTTNIVLDYDQNPLPPLRQVSMYVVGGEWPSTVLP